MSLSFQHMSGGNEQNMDSFSILGIDSMSTCGSLSNLDMLGSGASSQQLIPKKHSSANLVISFQLPSYLFPLEKGAQLAPERLLELCV